jgi:hypothetical protein
VGTAYFRPNKYATQQKMPILKIGVWMIFTKRVVQLGGTLCVKNKKLSVGSNQ